MILFIYFIFSSAGSLLLQQPAFLQLGYTGGDPLVAVHGLLGAAASLAEAPGLWSCGVLA